MRASAGTRFPGEFWQGRLQPREGSFAKRGMGNLQGAGGGGCSAKFEQSGRQAGGIPHQIRTGTFARKV